MTPHEKACRAIWARLQGIWDDEYLMAIGPLQGRIYDVLRILKFYGVAP